MIDRRTFLAGTGVVLLSTPLAAQQAGTVYRVGILSSANPRSAPIIQAFEQRLRELGYVEGQNVTIEFRNAEGQLDRLPGLALELVRLNVNAIVSASPAGTRAATGATTSIPIVMLAVNYDPIALSVSMALCAITDAGAATIVPDADTKAPKILEPFFVLALPLHDC